MGNLIKTMGKTLVEKTMGKECAPYSAIVVFTRLTDCLHFLCGDAAVCSSQYWHNACSAFRMSASDCHESSMGPNPNQWTRYCLLPFRIHSFRIFSTSHSSPS